uniref:Uncharacterized protein n=1 Tax=endosymbiont of Ridgeia piscesae TaxID=54398 RepID=D2CKY9_9GAMM|nr:hypothetical protein [endosymbiont of Ridgeia piscesae]
MFCQQMTTQNLTASATDKQRTAQRHERSSKMKKQTRMISNIINEAAKTDVVMPWTRGARRAAWIAKRNAPAVSLKVARG